MGRVLEMSGISKHFPGIQALDSVDFDLEENEIHALVGQNGAGKSTLIKIISGAHHRDAGTIHVCGQPVSLMTPARSRDLGIRVIYQELNLVPGLTVAENIYLDELGAAGIGLARMRSLARRASEVLSRIGVEIDPMVTVDNLTVGQKQMVEVAKALAARARIVVMDEPSAALSEADLVRLFEVVKRLKTEGVSVIYISHRLSEVFLLADRATVLKDGRKVATVNVSDVNMSDLIRMMIGRTLSQMFPTRANRPGEEILRVEGLAKGHELKPASFSLHSGEILGVFGVVGSGKTQLLRTLVGADRRTAGTIFVRGRPAAMKSPQEARTRRVGFLSEDRKRDGLILQMGLRPNLSISTLFKLCRRGVVDERRERSIVKSMIERMSIKCAHMDQASQELSGGNQQKLLLARWLTAGAEILVMDEPTRGVDVGSKAEIYQHLSKLAEEGVGVLIGTCETPEVLGLCDRVLVMNRGSLVADLLAKEATEERILTLAVGGARVVTASATSQQ